MEINYKSPEMKEFGLCPGWDVLWNGSETGESSNEDYDNDSVETGDDDYE